MSFRFQHLRHEFVRGPLIADEELSDPAGRIYPRGADANLARFCRLLGESGYDGRMSVEAYSQNFERDAAGALIWMREWTDFHRVN